MRAIDAYADLRRFGKAVVTTEDVAVRTRSTLSAASRRMQRLAASGLVKSLRRGLWALHPAIDPLALPEYLTAPFPAYVSCQSALYFHGLISQIPQVIFVASLGRTQRVTTSIGNYSIHHLAPEFFGGYQVETDGAIKMATPEKALLDVLYLGASRSRLFARLPEIELPRSFRAAECRRWIARIPAAYRRKMVENRLEHLLASRRA
jgi:predicted transcriptional regulator of viral defense system